VWGKAQRCLAPSFSHYLGVLDMSAIRKGASLAIVTASLMAHPRLISASPAANAAVGAPRQIQLHFSERLVPRFSGADIMRDVGKGCPPSKMNGSARLGPDGTTLTITPAGPLAKGLYRLAWHVVSVDTHRVSGSYTFQVR
jgi:methionine-rich copper-binding protein CopC